ncbi:MAG: hypothetical protein EOO40_00345 [Deltaproteobacteria bacterium]|nr:MAG: hypothetical protein EOO40_00345 [Deltaproteobacteria bacterium]
MTQAPAEQVASNVVAAQTGNMGQVPMLATPDYFAGLDAGTNAMAIVWRGTTPMTFNFYADVAAFQPQFGDAFKTVTLQPNSYQTVTLPQGFSGRLQKMTGRVEEPATWAEVTFNGWKDLTFFDVSYIRGNNGPCVMKMVDNSAISGTQEDFYSQVPADARGVSSTGQPYIKDTEGFDGSLKSDLINFYRQHVPTNTGYVRNFDDASSKGSASKHMVVAFY